MFRQRATISAGSTRSPLAWRRSVIHPSEPFAPDERSTGLQAWIFPIKLAMRLRLGGEQRARVVRLFSARHSLRRLSSGSGSTRHIPRAPVASPTAERPAHTRTPPAASTIVSAARICRRARDCSRSPSAIATTARPSANPSHRPTAPKPNGKASSQPPAKPIAQ